MIKLIVAAVLSLGIIATGVYIAKLHSDIKILEVNNATLKDTMLKYEQTISDQNDQIKSANEQSKQFQQYFDDIGLKLNEQSKKNDKIIQQLRNSPTPKTCDDAIQYLKANYGMLIW